MTISRASLLPVLGALFAAALPACTDANAKGAPDKVAQHLATFDDLDFNV